MLPRLFIRNYKDTDNPRVRNAYGMLTNIVGIIWNVLLCAAKITVGALFGSVAVTADGFNNLSDAGSSVISLIGFKLSDKPADKDHPFGHARIEYVTSLIISFIVVFLGVELIMSSIDKIRSGGTTDTDVILMYVLGASIAVKAGMYFYYRSRSRKIGSNSLKAAAADSLNDCISTGAVLICTLITYFTSIELDSYVGIAVALFIIVSGAKLVKETLNPLLGEKPDVGLVEKVTRKINSYDGVLGTHDLIMHNYGPGKYFASVHVEVDADKDILVSHETIDRIERDFMLDDGLQLVIHLDPVITNDDRITALRKTVLDVLKAIDPDIKMHDFRVVWGEKRKNLIFDAVVPVGYRTGDEELKYDIERRVKEIDPSCFTVVNVDKDYNGM